MEYEKDRYAIGRYAKLLESVKEVVRGEVESLAVFEQACRDMRMRSVRAAKSKLRPASESQLKFLGQLLPTGEVAPEGITSAEASDQIPSCHGSAYDKDAETVTTSSSSP